MEQTANYLPYESTGYFTKIVSDYLSCSPQLRPFYVHQPDMEGLKASLQARQSFDTPRKLLVEVLEEQYQRLPISDKVTANIQLLKKESTFTITTAHQPNIFTGPLYFIYKILHAVKLASELADQFPEYHFVPVYYMGSEDADLDELGFVEVGGQKLVWETKQTGAVGRMKVDKALIRLIHAIHGQAGVLPFGKEWTDLLFQTYTEGKTIQKATLDLVHQMFADFGLVVLIPDNGRLKTAFQSVVTKELTEQFSHAIVAETIASLGKTYKVQTGGRELNLFYLKDDKRERIEVHQDVYTVLGSGLSFTRQEILQELADYPERFSGNVILRGAFQETVLPNIAFIGGGGELAYWLELKNVFAAVGIPYPVLMLRNSFLLVSREQAD
ncbi:MAG: bacillithiol biosynthesis cysteine-adding enzyme BshC, partial [Bacteroidota bacterium]|nr:bacillithiol biosynthesis cysteine-adding enzyme BshC [Bacteroidota bacterium]